MHAARERLDALELRHAEQHEGEQLELPFLTVYTRTVCVRREKPVCEDLTPSLALSLPHLATCITRMSVLVCAHKWQSSVLYIVNRVTREMDQETASMQVSQKAFYTRSQVRQEYPLNLSISLSGGKETNKDSHSNCE